MSTRIDTGCEIAGHTLESFLPELRALQEQFAALAQQLSIRWLVRRATALRDRAHLGLPLNLHEEVDPEDGRGALSLAWRDQMARQQDNVRTSRRDSAVDYSAEVTLFPREGRLLAMAFIEHRELLTLWQQQAWRRDYAYWNHTDRPDEVTAADWERRRDDWNAIFKVNSVPSQVGYSFRLSDVQAAPRRPEASELDEQMPDIATRVQDVGFEDFLKHHPQRLVINPDGEDSISLVMNRMMEARRSSEFELWRTALPERLPVQSGADLFSRIDEKAFG